MKQTASREMENPSRPSIGGRKMMFSRKKSYSIRELALSTHSSGNCTNEQVPNCPRENTPSKKNHPFQAFFYVLLTSVFFTLTSVFVKKLAYINPGQLSLIRNVGALVGGLPIAVYKTKEVIGEKNDRLMLLLRGFLGGTALYLYLTAFRYLPLAEASIVLSTTPAVASLIAFLYLKEPCGFMQGISLILTIAGVLFSIRLPELLTDKGSTHFDFTYAMGLASGVGSVLLSSMSVVLLRKMKHVHFSTNLLYVGFVGMVLNASINAVTATYESPRCGWDQIFVTVIGVFGFLGSCTFTVSAQKESVGIVTILSASLDIIVAMVFQIIFFDEKLDAYNISGACVVIVSVSILGIQSWVHELPEGSKTRKILKLFLV